MSGAWGEMVAAVAREQGNPAYLTGAGWDAYRTRRAAGRRPLTNMGAAQREAFAAGASWVLTLQQQWQTLTVRDAIWELRRGDESVFYPLFSDAGTDKNASIGVECPADLIHPSGAMVLTDREGICLTCGYDLIDSSRVPEGDH